MEFANLSYVVFTCASSRKVINVGNLLDKLSESVNLLFKIFLLLVEMPIFLLLNLKTLLKSLNNSLIILLKFSEFAEIGLFLCLLIFEISFEVLNILSLML